MPPCPGGYANARGLFALNEFLQIALIDIPIIKIGLRRINAHALRVAGGRYFQKLWGYDYSHSKNFQPSFGSTSEGGGGADPSIIPKNSLWINYQRKAYTVNSLQ